MAKRRGPLGQLFTGFILLMIVAAGAMIGLAVFYDDDAFASQLRSLGVPEAQISKVMDLKSQVKDKADVNPGDLVFTARSIWWDLRDRFDLDLTDQVSRTLPRVRHVTQMEPMARPDDPKEPMAENKPGEALPADIQRETGEQPSADKPMGEGSGEAAMALPTAEDKPTAEPDTAQKDETSPSASDPVKAPATDDAQTAEKPMEEKASMEEKPAAAPEPAAPEATDKPMELTNPPSPEAPAEPTPAPEQTASVPPEPAAAPAAPVEAPPATAEERLAAADLTYKRALSLFADAKSQEQKAEAAKLFAQAAIGGHPGAQYSIGVMHYNGTGVAKDYAKAAEWFGRSAEKSNAAAQYNLGILYYNGQGVPKDDRLAYKWISAAAENGDQKAIVARDALKKALPADITKPEAPTFPGAAPAGDGTPLNVPPGTQQ